jgi:type II secretory pathway component PulF
MADSLGMNGEGGRLTGSEAAELSGRLAELTRSGLPLVSGLTALAEELPRGRLRRSMKALAGSLEAGVSLGDAIEGQRGKIPPHLRGLVIAGVRTGRMGDVLGQFSSYLGIGAELKRRLWVSLAYPMLSMAIAVTLFTIVSTYLIPQFELMFRDFGVPLPRLTVALLEIAYAVRSLWSVIALSAGALVLFWLMAPVFMRPGHLRSLAARVPILGGVWRWTSISEFCHLLGLLLEHRMPLPEALRLTGEGVQDADVESSCQWLARGVESGQTLAQAMAERRLFPAGLPRLVRWAEEQGSLAEVLHMAAEMFEARASAHATFTGTLLGLLSVLLIFWGLFTVIAGLMLPLVALMSRLAG